MANVNNRSSLGLWIILALGCSSVPEETPGATAVHALNSAPTVLLGDANQDGIVSITDAQVADAYSRGQNVPGLSPVAADANCDSIVDSEDVTLISEASAGLRTLRCPEPGDANGDGVIATAVDGMVVSQYLAGLAPAAFYESGADINCDCRVDDTDRLLIGAVATGLVKLVPCTRTHPGDANGDYRLSTEDALVAGQYAAGQTPTSIIPAGADVDCDGLVTAGDATRIAAAIAGQAPLFCPVLGDVDGNGVVDSLDTTRVEEYLRGENPAGFLAAAADADCDGTIEQDDRDLIAQANTRPSLLSCNGKPRRGDVDGDRRIDAKDALLVAQYAQGQNPSAFYVEAADADCDGLVTAADGVRISELVAGTRDLRCPKPGDADGDGKVSATDALVVVQYLQGGSPVRFHQSGADADCDGNIDADDMSLIMKASSGLIELDCSPYRRRGDVNGDRRIDQADALLVIQKTAGLDPAPFFASAADTNCDYRIDAADAQRISSASAGLTTIHCKLPGAAPIAVTVSEGGNAMLDDFEARPDGWEIDIRTAETAALQWLGPGSGINGSRAIGISEKPGDVRATWSRQMTLPAEGYYSIAAKLKGSGLDATSQVTIQVGDTVSSQFLSEQSKGVFDATGTFDWADTGLTFKHVGTAVETLTFSLRGPGQVWLDDVQIYRLTKIPGRHVNLIVEGSHVAGLAPEQVQHWVADHDRAWEAYADLIGGLTPEESAKMESMDIVATRLVDCWRDRAGIGCAWARAGYPITWGHVWVRETLQDYITTENLGFGILHEISHNFDRNSMNWSYDLEAMASLKVFWAVKAIGGKLRMPQVGSRPSQMYTGGQLRDYYAEASTQVPITWDRVYFRFIQVSEQPGGYQALANTFHHVVHLAAPLPEGRSARFDYFLQRLEQESPAFDVYGIFTPEEIAFARIGLGPQHGDVNADGQVNIVDAQAVASYTAGNHPEPFHPEVADANCDGVVDINDALVIARLSANLIDKLPCVLE